MRKEFEIIATAVIGLTCGALLSATLLRPISAQTAAKAQDALEQCSRALQSGKLVYAHDLWLIATNLDPGNVNLVKAAIAIIEKAGASTDGEAQDLATSLRNRLPLLLPYQKLEDVERLRQEIDVVAIHDENSNDEPSIDEQIVRAQKDTDPDVARMKLAALREETQSLLAVTEPSEESLRKRLNSTLQQLNEAELLLIKLDYDQYIPEVRAWHGRRAELEKAIEVAQFTKAGELSGPLVQLTQQGLKLAERLSIFHESGISEASAERDAIVKTCERLSKSIDWVYNQEALKVLHEIRDNHPSDVHFRSVRLVTVDPSRLNAVVLKRYNQEFHFLFNELLKEDESEALKLMKQMTLETLKQP